MKLIQPLQLAHCDVHKDDSTRFCSVFRRLNKDTNICKYPPVNPASWFDKLHRAHFFTSLDLKSAYWSITMAVEDKEKAVFTVRSGKREFSTTLFGLTNAVATFCMLWTNFSQGYNGNVIYVSSMTFLYSHLQIFSFT